MPPWSQTISLLLPCLAQLLTWVGFGRSGTSLLIFKADMNSWIGKVVYFGVQLILVLLPCLAQLLTWVGFGRSGTSLLIFKADMKSYIGIEVYFGVQSRLSFSVAFLLCCMTIWWHMKGGGHSLYPSLFSNVYVNRVHVCHDCTGKAFHRENHSKV